MSSFVVVVFISVFFLALYVSLFCGLYILCTGADWIWTVKTVFLKSIGGKLRKNKWKLLKKKKKKKKRKCVLQKVHQCLFDYRRETSNTPNKINHFPHLIITFVCLFLWFLFVYSLTKGSIHFKLRRLLCTDCSACVHLSLQHYRFLKGLFLSNPSEYQIMSWTSKEKKNILVLLSIIILYKCINI